MGNWCGHVSLMVSINLTSNVETVNATCRSAVVFGQHCNNCSLVNSEPAQYVLMLTAAGVKTANAAV